MPGQGLAGPPVAAFQGARAYPPADRPLAKRGVRVVSLPARYFFFGEWQNVAMGHPAHFGCAGSQRVCPNETR